MHRVNIELHEMFSALSDPYRIRIVRLMLGAKEELCLCDLSEALGEPEYKISRHVKTLRNAGLLTSEREGKWIYHSLVKNASYLKAILRAVSLFPNSEKDGEADSNRLKKLTNNRVGRRCTAPSRSIEMAEKRA
ncbi:MAG: metalloregulator ArsR/SmtB family transcription factor [Proteobacteria bacterium]|nr:MAG: metalloregulator ArsR/SmtB family transcription factor [Pseudomonadota bacterium]